MYKENIYDDQVLDNLLLHTKTNKYLLLKRILDIGLIVLVMPIAIPTVLFGMLLIKFTSKGPVLFTQKRVGLNNKPFLIYKLRTMVYQPEQNELSHTVENDERIFAAGKFLRVTKIDEIPQFLNVLKGDMSIIGPRPERVEIVDVLTKEIAVYPMRHVIKPGITGWAQINNPTATPNESLEKLEYDLYYIKNLSFALDLKIILKTINIILTRNSL